MGSPTAQHIDAALDELFDPRDDDDEHGDASLRHGYDDGPMHVVDITRTGRATFSQWADQDYEVELAPPLDRIVDRAQARAIWLLLAKGAVDEVRARFG
ncbi:hypothetical protein [Luteibacter yeojuensis]|uniref:Uncharacterized protein n=1 Tax=Luteibacter yeojuensis TaxID=345309 RepID=A0A0F3KMR4_9GAMM|nr:hypothetical protein [Luteibacter yeojuensis]KJV32493.1 hypothetical protein VI08_12190 [Luteibacter yeojuensis]